MLSYLDYHRKLYTISLNMRWVEIRTGEIFRIENASKRDDKELNCSTIRTKVMSTKPKSIKEGKV